MNVLIKLLLAIIFAVAVFFVANLFSGSQFCYLPGAHFPDPLVPTPTVGCFYSS